MTRPAVVDQPRSHPRRDHSPAIVQPMYVVDLNDIFK